MIEAMRGLLNPYVLVYLVTIAAVQLLYQQWRLKIKKQVATQRRTRGLPETVLLNRPERLAARRQQAFWESILLIATVVGLPFVLAASIPLLEASETAIQTRLGLAIVAFSLMATLLWGARDPLQAFVGGLMFKVFAAIAPPFEIGDRVTIGSISGKVLELSTFLLTLETAEGEQAYLPTYRLWTETIVSNPNRATRCETGLYLPLQATVSLRQAAELYLLETAQSSTYLAPFKLLDIHLSAEAQGFQLTVVAYAVSAEQVDALRSEITRGFHSFLEGKRAYESAYFEQGQDSSSGFMPNRTRAQNGYAKQG